MNTNMAEFRWLSKIFASLRMPRMKVASAFEGLRRIVGCMMAFVLLSMYEVFYEIKTDHFNIS